MAAKHQLSESVLRNDTLPLRQVIALVETWFCFQTSTLYFSEANLVMAAHVTGDNFPHILNTGWILAWATEPKHEKTSAASHASCIFLATWCSMQQEGSCAGSACQLCGCDFPLCLENLIKHKRTAGCDFSKIIQWKISSSGLQKNPYKYWKLSFVIGK